jgi:hypothetical protein
VTWCDHSQPSTSIGSSCVANMVCIWDQINYDGAKDYYDCNLLGTYGGTVWEPVQVS